MLVHHVHPNLAWSALGSSNLQFVKAAHWQAASCEGSLHNVKCIKGPVPLQALHCSLSAFFQAACCVKLLCNQLHLLLGNGFILPYSPGS